jgi:hypothetical protein
LVSAYDNNSIVLPQIKEIFTVIDLVEKICFNCLIEKDLCGG